MDAKKTLKEAYHAISRNENTYGSKEESFGKIGLIASIITGKKLDARDCVIVMLAVKLVRESTLHKDDNMVDLAGYASIMNDLFNVPEADYHMTDEKRLDEQFL